MNKKILYIALIFIVVFCLSFALTVGLYNFTPSDGPNNYNAYGRVNATSASVEVIGLEPSDNARCKVNFEIDLNDINWTRVSETDSLDERSDKSQIIDFLKSNAGTMIEKGQYGDDGWKTSCILALKWDLGYIQPVFDLKGNLTIKDNKLVFSGEGFNEEHALKDLKNLNPRAAINFDNHDKNATAGIEFEINKENIKINK